jgi:hypothetical protein
MDLCRSSSGPSHIENACFQCSWRNFNLKAKRSLGRVHKACPRGDFAVRAEDSSSLSTSGRNDPRNMRVGIKKDATKLVGNTPMVCAMEFAGLISLHLL